MIKKISLLLVFIFLSGCATWTTRERALGIASCVAAAGDTYTTLRGLDRPGNWETNPILGYHPSDTEVVTYMITSQVIALTLAHFFPKWRMWLLGAKTGINTHNTIANDRRHKRYKSNRH